jgi:hypothetical protein
MEVSGLLYLWKGLNYPLRRMMVELSAGLLRLAEEKNLYLLQVIEPQFLVYPIAWALYRLSCLGP